VSTYSDYVPDRGDIVWLQFNPRAGHEQGGRWPALGTWVFYVDESGNCEGISNSSKPPTQYEVCQPGGRSLWLVCAGVKC